MNYNELNALNVIGYSDMGGTKVMFTEVNDNYIRFMDDEQNDRTIHRNELAENISIHMEVLTYEKLHGFAKGYSRTQGMINHWNDFTHSDEVGQLGIKNIEQLEIQRDAFAFALFLSTTDVMETQAGYLESIKEEFSFQGLTSGSTDEERINSAMEQVLTLDQSYTVEMNEIVGQLEAAQIIFEEALERFGEEESFIPTDQFYEIFKRIEVEITEYKTLLEKVDQLKEMADNLQDLQERRTEIDSEIDNEVDKIKRL